MFLHVRPLYCLQAPSVLPVLTDRAQICQEKGKRSSNDAKNLAKLAFSAPLPSKRQVGPHFPSKGGLQNARTSEELL